MKRITPAGAALTLLGFFLPYVQSPSLFGISASRSGAQVGGTLWVVFIAAVAVLGAEFLVDADHEKEKRAVTVGASCIGLLFLGIGALALFSKSQMFGMSAADLGFKPGIGAWASAAGLVLSLYGSLAVPAVAAAIPDGQNGQGLVGRAVVEVPEKPALSDELKHGLARGLQWAGARGRALSAWLERQDLRAAVRRHATALALIGAVVVGGTGIYWFVKAKPGSDGAKAAVAFVNCQQLYAHSVGSLYREFLQGFSGRAFHGRSEAMQRVEGLLGSQRRTYDDCVQSAETQYTALSNRYSDQSDIQTFLTAFSESGGRRLSASEIEAADGQQAQVTAAIQTIQAPAPDSARIVRDLLGQQMAGWNFSYASEFRRIQVVSSHRDGDDLILRTNFKLLDNTTRQGYDAILDLRYHLGEDGEWLFSGFTQLLYAKEQSNYLINGQIFLVGRWRWRNNYATYNPDGTWFGRWDDGSQASGTWKIVDGNLVLIRNGASWVNVPIARFTANELVILVGSGPTQEERAERVADQ